MTSSSHSYAITTSSLTDIKLASPLKRSLNQSNEIDKEKLWLQDHQWTRSIFCCHQISSYRCKGYMPLVWMQRKYTIFRRFLVYLQILKNAYMVANTIFFMPDILIITVYTWGFLPLWFHMGISHLEYSQRGTCFHCSMRLNWFTS